ncbi:MAG: sialidase family protein [Cyclobacteriaceae bacterium]
MRITIISMLMTIILSCASKTRQELSEDLDLEIDLEIITKGQDQDYNWAHARTAVIPLDPPLAITTMSKTLKSGSDVYHDLYASTSQDGGLTWSDPQVISELKVRKEKDGYRSLADMWPKWHAGSMKVLNIGTAPFYSDDRTHDGWKKEVAYTTYDPETTQWSPSKTLVLPERDHEGMLFLAPAAGSAQWLELPNGNVLLPLFYFKITEEQAAMANRETFSVGNLMESGDFGFATTVVLCSFDGDTLTYKEHGTEIYLDQGRGVYEPSLAFFQEAYFLTMRSDKSAYVARSKDGLDFEPKKEWKFDDGSVLGSYNTQQHWISHNRGLFLVYTRKGADNESVFRHRAPLFMGQVDPDCLQVMRDTEKTLVPNRGVGLGNFGITQYDEHETWVTVAEYMRGEKNVAADNSVFLARIQWK